MMPQVITDPRELRRALAGKSVALVPTMGALHAGHLSLVEQAKRRAQSVVVSIFVNPTQFGPGEDYDAYPRQMTDDLAALATLDTDFVFTPSVDTMYPGFPTPERVSIDPGPTAKILEGALRPGHFAGVSQIVAKLFNLTQPDFAIFGQKDAQQISLIRQMVHDLAFPIEIVEAPIVRDADGLALSSRNAYLSAEERGWALALSKALKVGAQISESPLAMAMATFARLDAPGVTPDYAAVVTRDSFQPRAIVTAQEVSEFPRQSGSGGPAQSEECYLLVAGQVGRARLIDNTKVAI